MNPLLLSHIVRLAYDNYFECHDGSAPDVSVFSSSRHEHLVAVTDDGSTLCFYSPDNSSQLCHKFPQLADGHVLILKHPANDLSGHLHVLGTMFTEAAELPHEGDAPATSATEILAEVRERLGQASYRSKLLDRWDNACAVTGLTEPLLLRASHAKPWRDASDTERLDPANGLPLAVHLDALFDSGLISFQDDGRIILSPRLSPQTLEVLNVTSDLHLLKPLSPRQCQYMKYHREHIWQGNAD